MQVSFLPPQQGLEWLVIQYQTLIEKRDRSFRDKHLPRGDSAIVVNLRGSVYLLQEQSVLLPPAFITTVRPGSVLIENKGRISSLIINCHTSVLSRLLNLDLTKFKKEGAIDLESTPLNGLRDFLLKYSELPDPLLFPVFLQEKGLLEYEEDEIDQAYQSVLKKSPFLSFHEILENLGIHERRLRRQFSKRVGVSPKTLSRIVRVQYVFERILRQDVRDFMDLVSECGYCDQSHFIRDFKDIAGETPRQIFERDPAAIKFLSGIRD